MIIQRDFGIDEYLGRKRKNHPTKYMNYWQITKYDPKNRDEHNRYLKDEWTEYGDIGNLFDGKKLTFAEYFNIESKYKTKKVT